MDWMGTGQLRGEISVEEILASQKEHFKQVKGDFQQALSPQTALPSLTIACTAAASHPLQ